MKPATKTIICTVCLITAVLTCRSSAQYPDIKYSIGCSFEKQLILKMTEHNGIINPEYNHYRITSRQRFINGTITYKDNSSFTIKLGQTDLETHSSEGETTEFDARQCIGFEFSQLVPATSIKNNLWFNFTLNYMTFSTDEAMTTATAKNSFNSGGEVDITWKETEIAATAVFDNKDYDFFVGLHYTDTVISQDRDLISPTTSSELESDDLIGIHAGLTHALMEDLITSFEVTILNETAIKLAVLYTF